MIATGPYYLPIEGGEKITGMGEELSAPNLTLVEPWPVLCKTTLALNLSLVMEASRVFSESQRLASWGS